MKLKLETQNSRILKFMDENGSINQIEALQELGVMRLASRINDLRDSGYAIETKMKHSTNRWGEKVRFAEYRLL